MTDSRHDIGAPFLQRKLPPEAVGLPVVFCPACKHGIDPHGVSPGDYCGVGTLTEEDSGEGGLINVACKCLWSPNDIAAERWAHLRAQVQKLHEEPYPHIHYGGEPTGWRVALNMVLILLDQEDHDV